MGASEEKKRLGIENVNFQSCSLEKKNNVTETVTTY